MRVLVTGSRLLQDIERVWQALNRIHETRGPITVIIHGAARGADRLAKEWAQIEGIKHAPFRAAWDDIYTKDAVVRTAKGGNRYNALAGLQRNERMLRDGKPDLCVAFFLQGASNKGTKDMVDRCKRAGLEVIEG